MGVSVPPPGFVLSLKEDNPRADEMGEVGVQCSFALFAAALPSASYLACFLSVCNSREQLSQQTEEGGLDEIR